MKRAIRSGLHGFYEGIGGLIVFAAGIPLFVVTVAAVVFLFGYNITPDTSLAAAQQVEAEFWRIFDSVPVELRAWAVAVPAACAAVLLYLARDYLRLVARIVFAFVVPALGFILLIRAVMS